MYDDKWRIENDGVDIVLTGPGHLEIVLRHAEAIRAQGRMGGFHMPVPAARTYELGSRLRQRCSTYPLDEGMTLQLISTRETTNPEAATVHFLHLGTRVSWQLPEAVAQELHAFFVQATTR